MPRREKLGAPATRRGPQIEILDEQQWTELELQDVSVLQGLSGTHEHDSGYVLLQLSIPNNSTASDGVRFKE